MICIYEQNEDIHHTPKNLDLVDKNTPVERRKMQAYLDALAFEYKLLDFENSVWEW